MDAQSVDAQVSEALAAAVELTEASDTTACAQANCASDLAAQLGVSHVVTVSVQKSGPDHEVLLTLWDGNESVAEVQDTCEICGEAELLEVVGAAARALGAKADRLTRPGTLELTVPEGASVLLDGEALEDWDSIALLPGTYSIEVSLDGHESRTEEIEVMAGVVEQREIALEPLVTDPPHHDGGRGLRIGGYAGLGAGVAALGTGITLMAIEQRPITSDCSGENVDAEGTCKYRYATLEGGIALAVGGGVLLAGAIALIVVGQRRKTQSNVRVSASPTAVFLSGRF